MKSREGVPVYTFLFDTYFLRLFLPVAIILIVYISYIPLVIMLVIYFLYTFYIHFYAKSVSKQVYVHTDKKSLRLFVNEMEEISIDIHNNAQVPITHGKLDFILDKNIELMESKFLHKSLSEPRYSVDFQQEKKTVYTVRFPFKAKARGVYFIDDLNMMIHDFFGSSFVYFPSIGQGSTEIIVYPEQLEVKYLSLLSMNRIGEEEVTHSYFSDETSVVGVKPYEKESFRHIHWKATAKMQSMYSKQYQYITNKRYTVMLYITDRNGITLHEKGEKLISHTAFLCTYLTEKNLSYELYVNYLNKEGVFKQPLNTGINHLQRTLETLARVQDGYQFIRENQFISIANENADRTSEIIYISGEQPSHMSLDRYLYIGAEGELRRSGGKTREIN